MAFSLRIVETAEMTPVAWLAAFGALFQRRVAHFLQDFKPLLAIFARLRGMFVFIDRHFVLRDVREEGCPVRNPL